MTLWAEVSATPSIPLIPVPLEAYAAQIDDLFPRSQQRRAFRQHLADLLLPAERSKTLSAVANTERSAASRPRARSACPGSSQDCQQDTENVRFLTGRPSLQDILFYQELQQFGTGNRGSENVLCTPIG